MKDDHVKDAFYDELTETYDSITEYIIKIVLSDFNVKREWEPQ